MAGKPLTVGGRRGRLLATAGYRGAYSRRPGSAGAVLTPRLRAGTHPGHRRDRPPRADRRRV